MHIEPGRVREVKLRRPGGFTLIELVVTVALIAVLTGLLITAARSALRTTSQLDCAVRLQQVGRGVFQFGVDHGNRLPTHWEGSAVMFDTLGMRKPSGEAVNLGLLIDYDGGPEQFYCPTQTEQTSPSIAYDTALNPWNDGAGTVPPNGLKSAFAARTRRFMGGTLPSWSIHNYSSQVIYTDFLGVSSYEGVGRFKGTVMAPHARLGVNRLFGDGSVHWAELSMLDAYRPLSDTLPTPKQMYEYFRILDIVP